MPIIIMVQFLPLPYHYLWLCLPYDNIKSKCDLRSELLVIKLSFIPIMAIYLCNMYLEGED